MRKLKHFVLNPIRRYKSANIHTKLYFETIFYRIVYLIRFWLGGYLIKNINR